MTRGEKNIPRVILTLCCAVEMRIELRISPYFCHLEITPTSMRESSTSCLMAGFPSPDPLITKCKCKSHYFISFGGI